MKCLYKQSLCCAFSVVVSCRLGISRLVISNNQSPSRIRYVEISLIASDYTVGRQVGYSICIAFVVSVTVHFIPTALYKIHETFT